MHSADSKALHLGGRVALAGAALWSGLMIVQPPGWAGGLFLLAPLVALPLALPLLGLPLGLPSRALFAFAAGAGFLIPAFIVNRGVIAASFTAPWLVMCAGLAAVECVRWRHEREPARVLIAGYLAVGAGWLSLARLGARPLGFDDVIVQATAVHFHYAGFALPVVVGCLARADNRGATKAAFWGILLGVPLVAAGITLTVWRIHALELAATIMLASACWIAAWQQGAFAWRRRRNGARWLLMLSSLSLAGAMLLAVIYALGQFAGVEWLDIPFMLRFHGCAQVFGFALPALAAWHAVPGDHLMLSP
ncbi:MAG: YndJ family protein [Gemmataceae bacterium]|nr:YndJ family protein [Gemmataceae bacterium]